jgi:signal transduction histidine kinase
LDENTKQNLSSAQSSSKSLLYVIDDLLNLTGSQGDSMPEFFEAFDLKTMIHDTIEPLRHFAERKNLQLELVEHPGVHRHVRAEMHPVQRALSNLITNAIVHTDVGKVTVEWSCFNTDGSEVTRLSIADTGRGMTEEELDKLFQDLEQIADDTSEHDEAKPRSNEVFGMGLGLASVGESLPRIRLHFCPFY